MLAGNSQLRAQSLRDCYKLHVPDTISTCICFDDDEQGVFGLGRYPSILVLDISSCPIFYSLSVHVSRRRFNEKSVDHSSWGSTASCETNEKCMKSLGDEIDAKVRGRGGVGRKQSTAGPVLEGLQ